MTASLFIRDYQELNRRGKGSGDGERGGKGGKRGRRKGKGGDIREKGEKEGEGEGRKTAGNGRPQEDPICDRSLCGNKISIRDG
jgi:hypothetical protein